MFCTFPLYGVDLFFFFPSWALGNHFIVALPLQIWCLEFSFFFFFFPFTVASGRMDGWLPSCVYLLSALFLGTCTIVDGDYTKKIYHAGGFMT